MSKDRIIETLGDFMFYNKWTCTVQAETPVQRIIGLLCFVPKFIVVFVLFCLVVVISVPVWLLTWFLTGRNIMDKL